MFRLLAWFASLIYYLTYLRAGHEELTARERQLANELRDAKDEVGKLSLELRQSESRNKVYELEISLLSSVAEHYRQHRQAEIEMEAARFAQANAVIGAKKQA